MSSYSYKIQFEQLLLKFSNKIAIASYKANSPNLNLLPTIKKNRVNYQEDYNYAF